MNLPESQTDVFSRFAASEQELLSRLPYRVGLYVSFSDLTGGWNAQEKEMETLNSILREFSEDFCKSELSQKIIMQSLANRNLWPSWSQNIGAVPAEVSDAVDVVRLSISDKKLADFKSVLFDIATSVAMAFREENNEVKPRSALFGGLMERLRGGGTVSHVNVSAAERAALAKLAKALDYTPV